MTELTSTAEKFADKARELPAFKNFSLPGVKEQVAEMLAMIGRVKGVFSTYTKHDIDHVDNMLNMLEWLIPEDTRTKMTPVDWLLIVLAAYLHDLGMVVTENEFTERHSNPKFEEFLENIKNDPENKDYLDRVDKFDNDEEKDVFFFQEYIRLHHASRVREWINGRHSTQWGDKAKVVSDEIKKLLDPLPTRFKENLADVCASHHSDNLDKTEYFPLAQRYGTNSNEIANVQYAAILLRTIDLLHVTKDRTPSIMFKILRLSDPKGVEEWAKQNETFSVNMKYREFDLNNTETHIIVVSADFSDERGYFPLAEYIAYANTQLEQSRRWADASQKMSDGKFYYFPWQSIQGDIRVEGNEPVQMRFDLDRGRLLDLLVGHTIYNDPTVAVRELLQNAIDAVRYQYYLDKKSQRPNQPIPEIGNVEIKWNSQNRELIIKDHGVGMNLDVITFNLMRVGASFYNTPKFHSEFADFSPISRFGIGVLTCFMVSDNIEITTCQEDSGYRIKMTSVQSDYLIKKLEIGDPSLEGIAPHGTRIKLQLRKSIDLNKRDMEEIVRYWIILPPCTVIYRENNEEPVNIGFSNPAEALRYFFSEGDNAILGDETEYDIVQSSIQLGGGHYQLAFAVAKGFTPEKNFIQISPEFHAPAVCIEGIRTSDTLPGFGLSTSTNEEAYMFVRQTRGICAMLSVQGNKKFRTTVSRMDLEQDDEFIKVSEICGKMLFDYVETEVQRISNQPNRPLSQASTAGNWIYYRLYSAATTRNLKNYLQELYKKLPLIVVESVDSTNGKIVTTRELFSQAELEKIESFWTIESRLVDSLGIISRDMGRELSLNDFLSTLAPDFRDPRINLVLPDAEEFRDEILESHIAINAEFSRRYQQTLVEWKRDVTESPYRLNKFHSLTPNIEQKIYKLIEEIEILLNNPDRSFMRDLAESPNTNIMIVPIIGDIKDIFILKTRVTIFIREKSLLAEILLTLSKILEDSISTSQSDEEIAKVCLAARTLIRIIEMGDLAYASQRRYYQSLSARDLNYLSFWKVISEMTNKTLTNFISDFQLPERSEDVIGGNQNRFDASKYWMNWSQKTGEEFEF